MNKYMCMVVIISASINAMEDNKILIKTSDNADCRLLQWQVDQSRLLLTKQEWQLFKEKRFDALPAPIILKTICKEELQLFSDALYAHDFVNYFRELTDKKKNVLLDIIRPHKLDSPYLMIQCFSMHCPENLLEKYFSTLEIAEHLQNSVIFDNCKHKKFMQSPIEKYNRYFYPNVKSSYKYSELYTSYHCLPPVLANKNSRFSGITNPSLMRLSDDPNKCWLVQNVKNNNKIMYYFTPIDPVDNNNKYDQIFMQENKKKLWALICEKDKDIVTVQKVIEHTNAIEGAIFSDDGKYLVTTSVGEQGELMLSDIIINNNTFIGSDILLTGHQGWVGPICFNKKSTMLATVSLHGVHIWDLHKKSLVTKFNYQNGIINIISFNHNDSRFVTIAYDPHAKISFITLWDSTDICNIFCIKTISYPDEHITGISFTPLGDKLIIETKCSAMILDGLSGEIIMETGIINKDAHKNSAGVHAVLMTYLPILVTTSRNDQSQCNVVLWNINTKEHITLLENQKDLVGIGLNSSGRYIISLTAFFGMITKELYDKTVVDCLQWLHNKPNLLQRYLLHRLHVAQQNNESIVLHPNSPECRILQGLPTDPCVKEIVEKYLISKKIS